MGITIRTDGEDVLLPVHAQAGARRDAITGEHGGRLKVSITQAAEKGKANREIVRLLAASLGIARAQVTLHAGESSPLKVIRIRGLGASAVRDWLARACG